MCVEKGTWGIKEEVAQGFRAARKLYELSNGPIHMTIIPRSALAMLETLAPHVVSSETVLSNPPRVEASNALIKYQISLNDEIDFAGSGRTDIDDILQNLKESKAVDKACLDEAILQLTPHEKAEVEGVIQSAENEVRVVEDDIRAIRDTRPVRFEEADRYRSLANAISEVEVIGVLLGADKLKSCIQPIEECKLSMEAIEDKYRWLIDDMPSTSLEKAMSVMHSTCQAVQIIDDWNGRHIDPLLRIPTYASAALYMHQGDEDGAHRYLAVKRKEYEARARRGGLNRFSSKAASTFMNLATSYVRSRTIKGKNTTSETKKEKIFNSLKHPREQNYVLGKLDE